MKIIGVCGSPRKGNTEWMLNRLMSTATQNGAETETYLLRKMNIKLCLGCLTCDIKGQERPGICVQKDEMSALYPKLRAADIFVLATPVYFDMLSGLLKDFLDRTCPIWPFFAGKKMAGLAVAEDGIGLAIENLKTYASICKMQWIGSVTTLAKTPDDAARNSDLAQKLDELALKLT